ncbi:MAG: hypothetical protein QY320_00005 [Gammaproteobacteria bacterium]|nr:MAG: hypothetical protein QY320_00005 [Gammaproteobacteria bacterium]
MKYTRTFLCTAFAVMLGACGGGEAPPSAADATPPAPAPVEPTPAADAAGSDGITARAMLEQAMAEATRWEPDAELVIVTTSLAESPRPAFWFYDVQSRAKGRCTRIRALANGAVANVGTGEECVLMKPVSEGFVDSPVAWDAARAAGFEPGDTAQFGLRFQQDEALPEPRECWVLWSDVDGDEAAGLIRGWCVDPSSGQFVARLSGKGRTVPLQQ